MRVTVFGSARVTEGHPAYDNGVHLGRMLGEAGHVVVSGGYGGVMEAVSRGAHEAGGVVVGVTVGPWVDRLTANQYIGEERSAATLFERLEALVESDAMIALDGGAGTLAEVALAWNLRQMNLIPARPIILVGEVWRQIMAALTPHLIIDERDLAFLTMVSTVEDAFAALGDAVSGEGNWFG